MPVIYSQGHTGRDFQHRVGSSLGIEKIFRVGLGIFIKYQVNRELSGIEVSPSISPLFPIFSNI